MVSKQTKRFNKNFAKLLMSSYIFYYNYLSYKLINNANSTTLNYYFNTMRHCYDYKISSKFKKQVKEMYRRNGCELPMETLQEEYKKNLGIISRSKYFFKMTKISGWNIQRLYDEFLSKQSNSFSTCSNKIFLLIMLVQFNKEILWNTSLQDYESKVDWQQEIIDKKGEDFFKNMQQGISRSFAKRLYPSKRYNVCEWCTFLYYWLKHGNDQCPSFFAKLELIVEIYPHILTRLQMVYDDVCQKLDKSKKQDEIYQAFKEAFNRDRQSLGGSKIDELCVDDIKYLSQFYQDVAYDWNTSDCDSTDYENGYFNNVDGDDDAFDSVTTGDDDIVKDSAFFNWV